MTNPMDELNVQLPGRLMTVEILVTLLLREKANARKLLVAAENQLGHLEGAVLADTPAQHRDYAMKMFEAARQNLDAFNRNVRA